MKRVVVGIVTKKGRSDEDTYLLVQAKKNFGRFTRHYYPPGGHLEEGESETACLLRELKEELGLDVVRCRKVTESPGDVPDQITSWYTCDVKSFELTVDTEELDDAGFFSKGELEKMKIWPATRDFFDKYIFNKGR